MEPWRLNRLLILTIHATETWKHCPRRVPTCSGQTHQELQPDRQIDTLSVGVDRIQRNFEPMRWRQVETWRQTQISDEQAKLIFYSFYSAFVEENSMRPGAFCPMSTGCTLSRSIPNLQPGPCGPVECLHQRFQDVGSDSPIQGNGQAWRISQLFAG